MCGSPARIGLPDRDRSPETTQLLLPVSSGAPTDATAPALDWPATSPGTMLTSSASRNASRTADHRRTSRSSRRSTSGAAITCIRPVSCQRQDIAQAALSRADHGSGVIPRRAYSIGSRSWRVSMTAFTPEANASRSERVSGSSRSTSASAARCNPSVRATRSDARPSGPSSAAIVPSPRRRRRSIWKSRSWAWATPYAMNSDRSSGAAVRGTPRSSRRIVVPAGRSNVAVASGAIRRPTSACHQRSNASRSIPSAAQRSAMRSPRPRRRNRCADAGPSVAI